LHCRQRSLEAESQLEVDGARSQSVQGHPESLIQDIGIDVGEIGVVEQVVEIRGEYKLGVLAKEFHRWQAETFTDADLGVKAARAELYVAAYGRGARNGARRCGPCNNAGQRRPVNVTGLTGLRIVFREDRKSIGRESLSSKVPSVVGADELA
jgi:hypothetical protein